LAGSTAFVRPHLQAGVEWKLQARLGWSFLATVYPMPAKAEVHAYVLNGAGMGSDADMGKLAEFTLPLVGITTSLALYF